MAEDNTKITTNAFDLWGIQDIYDVKRQVSGGDQQEKMLGRKYLKDMEGAHPLSFSNEESGDQTNQMTSNIPSEPFQNDGDTTKYVLADMYIDGIFNRPLRAISNQAFGKRKKNDSTSSLWEAEIGYMTQDDLEVSDNNNCPKSRKRDTSAFENGEMSSKILKLDMLSKDLEGMKLTNGDKLKRKVRFNC